MVGQQETVQLFRVLLPSIQYHVYILTSFPSCLSVPHYFVWDELVVVSFTVKCTEFTDIKEYQYRYCFSRNKGGIR